MGLRSWLLCKYFIWSKKKKKNGWRKPAFISLSLLTG